MLFRSATGGDPWEVPPLLATLASMNLIAGLELVLTQNTVLATDSELLDSLASGVWLGVPALAWVSR